MEIQETREIYQNGKLLRTEKVSVNKDPRYTEFNLTFINLPFIKRVLSESSEQVAVKGMISLSTSPRYDVAIIKTLWDAILDGSQGISEIEISQLNQICLQNFMPFVFDSNGYLVQN